MDEPRQEMTGNCPNCGLPLATASNLTFKNGLNYCCEECSAGGDCVCPEHSHSAAARSA